MYENGLDFSIGGSVDRKRQRRVVFYGSLVNFAVRMSIFRR